MKASWPGLSWKGLVMVAFMLDSKVNIKKIIQGNLEDVGQLYEGPEAWEIATGLPMADDAMRRHAHAAGEFLAGHIPQASVCA